MWDWQNDRWLNPKQGLSRTHMKMIVGDVNFIWAEWGNPVCFDTLSLTESIG